MSRTKRTGISILMILVMMFSAVALQTEDTYAATSKVKFTGYNYPKSIVAGKNYKIKGIIKANKKIKRVEIGIVKASTNKWTAYKYDNKKVKSKSFNVKKAQKKLKFSKLPAGSYYYRIYAHTSNGVKIVLNKKFTVTKAKTAQRIAAAKKTTENKNDSKNDKKTVTELMPTEASKEAAAAVLDEKVTLSAYNSPSKLSYGSGYSIKGRISCNNTIRRVEIGIAVTATNKWSEYKYENASVNAKEFDVANAASALEFDKLPGGTFTYRIYVHTDKAVYIVLNKSFTVTASDKPQKAIAWATEIANDNQYTYGRGYGGYFTCCICAGKTEKKADAQFTCMPFLAAAYAHASNHHALMNNGRHMLHLNDDNFKGGLGDCWFKVGLCKDLTIEDLQPGDVIIKWSATNDSGHAWMYGGGDKIIEAVPSDIRVLNTGAAAKLHRYGFSEGSTSKNYVMRYRGN